MDISSLSKRAGLLAFLFPLFIYTLTLCPTVFWDDAGELIAAAYTLGVPHPPGHPLYAIVGKLFTLIPLGSIAWRVNFMSAFFGALSCLLVYKIITERLGESRFRPVAALGGALFFAFAPTMWEQSTIAETTTLHTFFMMLLTLLAFRLASGGIVWKSHERSLCLVAFLYGLSLSNHAAGVFFFPSIAGILILKFKKRAFEPKLLLGMFFSTCAGLLVYAYLPLRSLADPAIDWGNPENLRNFIWVVTAKQYAPNLVGRPNIFVMIGQIFLRASYLLDQFTILGVALAAVGVWRLARVERRAVAYSLLVIGILFYIGLNSAFISAYFAPALALIAVWIGVGLSRTFEWAVSLSDKIGEASKGALAKKVVCAMLGVTFALPLGINYRGMDRSEHAYALRYGEQLLDQFPENTAFFTSDGYALFILWYLIYCENKRPDVVVIDPTWVSSSVALRSQVIEQYPDLALPSPETVARYTAGVTDPESRQYLVIQSVLDANSGRRPIYWGMLHEALPFSSNLAPEGIVFRYSVDPVELDEEALARNLDFWESEVDLLHADPQMKADKIAKEIYPAELNNQGLMFEQIGRDDLSRRMIEFALEFNPQYPTSRYNLARLEARAGNPEAAARQYELAVEGNPYMAVAYYGLGNARRNLGRLDEAFMAYRRAVRLYPDYHEAITAMGQLYSLAGQQEDALEKFQRALGIEPEYVFALRGIGATCLQMNRLDEAKVALDKALKLEPGSASGLFTLSKYYARIGSDEMAADALARSIRSGGKDRLADALEDEDLREVAARLSLEEGGASKGRAEDDRWGTPQPIKGMKMGSRIEA